MSIKANVTNLTPHDIHIRNEEGQITTTFPASGTVVRVQSEVFDDELPLVCLNYDNLELPLVAKVFTDVIGLPVRPQEGELYIVSLVTAMAVAQTGRATDDLLIVHDETRDKVTNQVNGCRGLATV